MIRLWDEQHSPPERVPGDLLSAESVARAIALVPHPSNTLQRKSGHVSHNSGSFKLAGVGLGIQEASLLPRTGKSTEPQPNQH